MTLPQGWSAESLGNACSLLTDGTHHSPSNSSSGQFAYITAKNIKWHGLDLRDLTYVSGEEHATIYRRCPVLAGDVLLIKDGATTGVATINDLDEPFSMLSSVALLRPIADLLDNRFLWRWLKSASAQSAMLGAMSGSAIRRLTLTKISQTDVPIPPLAEQRRIVAKLDALTDRLARARAELDRVPVLAEHLRQAAISAVTTAAGATTVRFDEVLDYKGGSQPPKSTFHAELADGRIRLLQIRDFASDQKAVFIDDNGKWPRCEADDIMIGRYGASVGKILTGKAGAYNVALVKMIFDRGVVDPRFLFHWLKGDTFQGRLREISRSAQDGFNKEDLAELPFPLLSLASQTEAAERADALIARADRLEAEAARARALLDRLESALLAKAFRGELVPQDPNDEPAQTLLDRIRTQRAAAPKAKRGRKAKVAGIGG